MLLYVIMAQFRLIKLNLLGIQVLRIYAENNNFILAISAYLLVVTFEKA